MLFRSYIYTFNGGNTQDEDTKNVTLRVATDITVWYDPADVNDINKKLPSTNDVTNVTPNYSEYVLPAGTTVYFATMGDHDFVTGETRITGTYNGTMTVSSAYVVNATTAVADVIKTAASSNTTYTVQLVNQWNQTELQITDGTATGKVGETVKINFTATKGWTPEVTDGAAWDKYVKFVKVSDTNWTAEVTINGGMMIGILVRDDSIAADVVKTAESSWNETNKIAEISATGTGKNNMDRFNTLNDNIFAGVTATNVVAVKLNLQKYLAQYADAKDVTYKIVQHNKALNVAYPSNTGTPEFPDDTKTKSGYTYENLGEFCIMLTTNESAQLTITPVRFAQEQTAETVTINVINGFTFMTP